jgi:hypothetical protein
MQSQHQEKKKKIMLIRSRTHIKRNCVLEKMSTVLDMLSFETPIGYSFIFMLSKKKREISYLSFS